MESVRSGKYSSPLYDTHVIIALTQLTVEPIQGLFNSEKALLT
jgi:hypothetical protein